MFGASTAGLRLGGGTAAAGQRVGLGGLRGSAGADVHDVQERPRAGFVPQQDQGRIIVSVQLPDAASLRAHAGGHGADRRDRPRRRRAWRTRSPCAGFSFVQAANGSNFGSMFVILDPFEKRRRPELSDVAIMARLRPQWARQVKDAQVARVRGAADPGPERGRRIQAHGRGPRRPGAGDPASSRPTSWSRNCKKSPALVGVSTQFRSNTPQLYVDIDRTKVASLGVPLDDVNQTLQIYLGSLYVNNFNAFGRHWQVNVQAEGDYRNRVDDINLLEGPQQPGADGAAGHAGQRARDRRPDLRQPLQPVHGRGGQREPQAGSQLGRGDRGGRQAGRPDAAACR